MCMSNFRILIYEWEWSHLYLQIEQIIGNTIHFFVNDRIDDNFLSVLLLWKRQQYFIDQFV